MMVLLSTGVWGIVLGVASIAIAVLIYFFTKDNQISRSIKICPCRNVEGHECFPQWI